MGAAALPRTAQYATATLRSSYATNTLRGSVLPLPVYRKHEICNTASGYSLLQQPHVQNESITFLCFKIIKMIYYKLSWPCFGVTNIDLTLFEFSVSRSAAQRSKHTLGYERLYTIVQPWPCQALSTKLQYSTFWRFTFQTS